MKRWLRWSSRAEVQQWDTYPGPKRWRSAISHLMNGIIFTICSIYAFWALPAALKPYRKECNKKQEKKWLEQSRGRRWTWFRRLRRALLQRRVRMHEIVSVCSEHPVSKVRIPWQVQGTCGWSMKSEWRRVEFSSVSKRCRKRRLAASGTNQEESARKPRSRKFRNHWRRLAVAEQLPHISCLRSTPRESQLELATTTQTQAKRQNGRLRCEYVDRRNVYDCHSASRSSSCKRLFLRIYIQTKISHNEQ